jgi:lycopene elongase/hydratase (dihydrobisanhydrobacterioruberin-forming)
MRSFLKSMSLDKVSFITKISRPRFWLYLAGPYLLGTITFSFLERSFAEWALLFYGFVFFLIPANIILYGLNDYFDFDTDQYNKKKTDKESLLLGTSNRMLVARYVGISLILSLPLFYYLDFYGRALLGLFLFLSFSYSAPPLRFKSKVILDSLTNILYVLPGLIAYRFSLQLFPTVQVVVASFLWAIAMHLFSAIPDIVPDKKGGIRTTAVFFGKEKSLLICAVIWFLVGASLLPNIVFFLIGLMYASIPFMLLIRRSSSYELEKTYWRFPFINGLVGFFIFIYMFFTS